MFGGMGAIFYAAAKANARGMEGVTGWTCTCKFKAQRVEKDDLVQRKEDVRCYDEYWNHDTDGKPIQVRIKGKTVTEVK